MSDPREAMLRSAIRHVNSTVEPITFDELMARPAVDIVEALPEISSVDLIAAPPATLAYQGPRRPWLIGIAAAAVILLAVWLFGDPDDGRIDTMDPAENTTPEQPTELTAPPTGVEPDDSSTESAQRFVTALSELDRDVLHSLIAPGADAIRVSPWDRATLDQELDDWEFSGSRMRLIGCEPLPGDGFASCPFEVDDIVTRAQGLAPVTVLMTIGVQDGMVHTAAADWNDYREWADEPWGAYGQWARTNRPAEFEALYPSGAIRPPDVSDPEIRATFTRVLADYEREQRRSQLTESNP